MPTVFACSANAQLTPPSYDGSQQLDTKREEVSTMRRRVMALTVAAVMAAMRVTGSAGPVFVATLQEIIAF
jgi:hypothetical protein